MSITHEQVQDLRFISAAELSLRTNRHIITIYRWAKHQPHRLPRALRVGGSLVFLSTDVDAWFLQQAESASVAAVAKQKRRGRPTKLELALRRDVCQVGQSVTVPPRGQPSEDLEGSRAGAA